MARKQLRLDYYPSVLLTEADWLESEGCSPGTLPAKTIAKHCRAAYGDIVRLTSIANAAERPLNETVPQPERTTPMDEPILQFFAYAHLPPQLQEHSRPFADLANQIVATLPRNPERTVALRKLLEAKDAAVRAKLFK